MGLLFQQVKEPREKRKECSKLFFNHIKSSEVPKLTPFKLTISSNTEGYTEGYTEIFVMKYTNNRFIVIDSRQTFKYNLGYDMFIEDKRGSNPVLNIYGWEEITMKLVVT